MSNAPENVIIPANVTKWLTDAIASYVNVTPQSLDVDISVAEYGLDSVNAVTLVGDIERAFGLSLEPTFVWDYPTIREMAVLIDSEMAT
ncbi:acyl carrier protein [Nocardia acidivorans]|uniref:acyl carrier protein n=1 Tax=Nocardia acidivorans TaxID=404580 RepID=UPI000833C998|nr:acyl carrier protein [Nocardia acidivorans]